MVGLSKETEIIEASLQAIRDSIPFLVPVLDNMDYCNKTFEYLMPMMNNDEFRERVYEIMFEFCKYCYFMAQNYLKIIVQFTTAHMQSRN